VYAPLLLVMVMLGVGGAWSSVQSTMTKTKSESLTRPQNLSSCFVASGG
jgi:hypothetical protein